MRRVKPAGQRGYTFVELLVVTTVLLVLASAIMPLAQVTSQRQREAEVRRALREMRTAIDAFKNAVDQGRIPTTELEPGSEGYPPDLETLVEGVSAANDATGRKLRFMRTGGIAAAFTQQVDAATGRIDIAIVRPGDLTGVAGTGLLGAILFDAVGGGPANLTVTGSATAPRGTPVPLQFGPAPGVTVR